MSTIRHVTVRSAALEPAQHRRSSDQAIGMVTGCRFRRRTDILISATRLALGPTQPFRRRLFMLG